MSDAKPKVEFVEYDKAFLNKSWDWLNDPEIKELTLTSDFTRSEQLQFFQSIPNRNDFKIWGVKYGNTPIGVVGLKNITSNDAEYFGYIGEKNYWGLGLFKYLLEHIVDKCITMRVSNLYLHVTLSNERAIKAYNKNGFIVVDKECNILRMEMTL